MPAGRHWQMCMCFCVVLNFNNNYRLSSDVLWPTVIFSLQIECLCYNSLRLCYTEGRICFNNSLIVKTCMSCGSSYGPRQ